MTYTSKTDIGRRNDWLHLYICHKLGHIHDCYIGEDVGDIFFILNLGSDEATWFLNQALSANVKRFCDDHDVGTGFEITGYVLWRDVFLRSSFSRPTVMLYTVWTCLLIKGIFLSTNCPVAILVVYIKPLVRPRLIFQVLMQYLDRRTWTRLRMLLKSWTPTKYQTVRVLLDERIFSCFRTENYSS